MAPDHPTFTLADLWTIKMVSDVQLSPDGTTIAYVVANYDEEQNSVRAAIWLARLADGHAWQCTTGALQDTQPRWSPDGQTLAFLSTRQGGAPQIYRIAVQGGEARQVTQGAAGIQAIVWSPDGKHLCYVAAPETDRQRVPQEEAWRAAHPKAAEQAPRLRRQSTLKSRFDGRGYIDRRSHLFVIDLDTPGAAPRQLTHGDYDHLEPAWSPDGALIAFIANRSSDEEHSFATDLWTVSLASGEIRCLTNGDLTAAAPSWSPDGATIAFYARPQVIMNPHHDTHVWTVARAGGDARDASAALDRSRRFVVADYHWPEDGAPVWSADGTILYFLAMDRDDCAIFALTPADGNVRRVSSSRGDVAGVQCTPDGRTLVCLASTPSSPYDVFVVPAAGGELRPLVETNQELLSVRRLASPEYLAFKGPDGWDIHGWLYRPTAAAAGQPSPLILSVHGGPHAAWAQSFHMQAQIMAGAGYGTLYINPRGSLGYGQAFAQAADWGEKDYQDLMAGVDAALATGGFDVRRLGMMGLSYGGFMTNWAIGHTDRFAAAVSINGVSNMVTMYSISDIGIWCEEIFGGPFWADEERWQRFRHHSPISYVDRIATPLLLIQAEQDFRCPIDQGEQMLGALRVRRQTVELIRVPGASHLIAASASPHHRYLEWQLIKDWFDTHL
jgi:dipeptidyl aminopeptidase/acylaminoacyl peptidase